MKEFIVIACYYVECRASAHLFACRVTTRNAKAAAAQVREQILAGNYDPGDILVFTSACHIPTLEEIAQEMSEEEAE